MVKSNIPRVELNLPFFVILDQHWNVLLARHIEQWCLLDDISLALLYNLQCTLFWACLIFVLKVLKMRWVICSGSQHLSFDPCPTNLLLALDITVRCRGLDTPRDRAKEAAGLVKGHRADDGRFCLSPEVAFRVLRGGSQLVSDVWPMGMSDLDFELRCQR